MVDPNEDKGERENMIYNLIELANERIGNKTALHCPKCGTRLRKYHVHLPEADGSYYPYTGLICNVCGLKSRTHYNDKRVKEYYGYRLSKAAAKQLLKELTDEVNS